MPKVSVIVPFFNVEKYIDRCLNSLINQTLRDIEIIVVNDGSEDNSKSIVERYMPKIRYFEKENGGLSSARNYGMRYATGEYIAFLDSDDYIEKNMYEEMYKKAKEDNADLVECDFIWQWEEKSKIKYDKRKKYKSREEMMKKPRVVAWNKLIKREIIKKNNIKFPEGLIYEDLEFFYKILPFVKKISYIEKFFVHYMQRESSISNMQTEKNIDIFRILNNISDFYRKMGIYDNYKKQLKYMNVRILLGSSMKRTLKMKDSKLRRKMMLKTVIYLMKLQNESKEIFNIEKNVKQKICFGITKLGIGGAERVLVDMVNELQKEYDITIFTIYGGGELEKELDKNINVISLYKEQRKSIFIPIYILIFGKHLYNKFLRNKYDVDIAFLEGPITRIFSYKGNKKKIVWVHNDIKKVFGKSLKAKIKQYIDKNIYKRYDKIIFVSEQNKKSFEKLYGNISERRVIYNYINKDRIINLSNQEIPLNEQKKFEHEKIMFLTVARLTKQKAIDRFIKVHKRLIDEGLYHKVCVIGDGDEKENLIKLINELNVEDTFLLLGKKENPYPYMRQAQYFVLLSYYEGYGMVLEEAKILNKPIIITDTAAIEAVQNYDRKLIIENDEEKIYEGLRKIINENDGENL